MIIKILVLHTNFLIKFIVINIIYSIILQAVTNINNI